MIDLVQSVVRSPSPSGPFSFSRWVGTIGGSALPTDPNPNVTPPAAGRILRMTAKRGAVYVLGRLNQGAIINITVIFAVVAASSITVQLWFYDDTQARWVPLDVQFTRTPTSGANNLSLVITNVALPPGAKVFPQITANTNVQAMGYDCT